MEYRRKAATPRAAGQAGETSWYVREVATGGWALDLGTELELADRIRSGIPTAAVDEAIAIGLVEADVVYDLVVPRRTLAHRKGKAQRLSVEQSDRFARVLRIYARAADALGDMARGSRWLSKANRALEGRRPLDLLGSDAGTRAVEKVLGRIEHGVTS